MFRVGFFQLEDFRCCHTAALWNKKLSPRSYVSSYYTKESFVFTYSNSIYPSGLDLYSNNSYTDQAFSDVLPLDKWRPHGWPKKKRYTSVGKHILKWLHSGTCGRFGHNKRSFEMKDHSIFSKCQRRSVFSYIGIKFVI